MGLQRGFAYISDMMGMEEEIESWLISWFEKNAGMESMDLEGKMGANYLSSGWIDSFKFMEFVNDIEERYGIRFSNEEFQDRSFSTLRGLARIIAGKINGKG